jgi:hypothetical protein
MAIDWNEYELVLEEESSKVCEVTGDDMGGSEFFTCPLRDLIKPDKSPRWTPEGNYGSYGGYQAYHFSFKGADDEGVHIAVDKHYKEEIVLKPGDKWSSGWYSFGEWSYCVRLTLRKIEKTQNKSSK